MFNGAYVCLCIASKVPSFDSWKIQQSWNGISLTAFYSIVGYLFLFCCFLILSLQQEGWGAIVKGIALLSPKPKKLLLKPFGYSDGFKFLTVSSTMVIISLRWTVSVDRRTKSHPSYIFSSEYNSFLGKLTRLLKPFWVPCTESWYGEWQGIRFYNHQIMICRYFRFI